jgi:hypothetical protein
VKLIHSATEFNKLESETNLYVIVFMMNKADLSFIAYFLNILT